MMESDIVHGPGAFVFLFGIAKNLRHHNRPMDTKAYGVQFNNPQRQDQRRNEPRAMNSNTMCPETDMRLWNWVISKRATNAPTSSDVVS